MGEGPFFLSLRLAWSLLYLDDDENMESNELCIERNKRSCCSFRRPYFFTPAENILDLQACPCHLGSFVRSFTGGCEVFFLPLLY